MKSPYIGIQMFNTRHVDHKIKTLQDTHTHIISKHQGVGKA